jgi:hypothetical protein
MSSFCHLVIILSKYIFYNAGDTEQPWRAPLLISNSFYSLELNLINIGFVYYYYYYYHHHNPI